MIIIGSRFGFIICQLLKVFQDLIVFFPVLTARYDKCTLGMVLAVIGGYRRTEELL